MTRDFAAVPYGLEVVETPLTRPGILSAAARRYRGTWPASQTPAEIEPIKENPLDALAPKLKELSCSAIAIESGEPIG